MSRTRRVWVRWVAIAAIILIPVVLIINGQLPEIRRRWGVVNLEKQWLAFSCGTVGHGSYSRLYLIKVNGQGLRPIYPMGESRFLHYSPAWSPDGEWIAFTDNTTLDDQGINLIRPDGNDLHLFLRGALDPAWSPDGEWIAFEDWEKSGDSHSDIYLIRSDGSGLRKLTDLEGLNQEPAWSPDGEWIAFEHVVSGEDSIYLIRPDGSDLHLLVEDAGSPAWSPDGEWIAFTRSLHVERKWGDYDYYIYRIRSDGSELQPVTEKYDRLELHGSPAWSPDGKWIAFAAHPTRWWLPAQWTKWQVFVVRPDGTRLRQVTRMRGCGAGSPSWSPALDHGDQ